ncbi:Multiple RNA-binding domain-containing protein 1 [Xanthoria calcicola]
MDSSRIFIRGLPPNMNGEDFRRHFSKQSDITDARLIPHRRIGYVGYQTPEDAKIAVKYHDKTFINMSRIRVELARSVGQESALNPRRHAQHNPTGRDPASKSPSVQGPSSLLKRKRDDKSTLEEHPKLKEFLEVMQPSSKSRTWANEIKDIKGDTLGQQDITVNEEVDGHGLVTSPNDAEYQEVPHKHKKPRDNINEASQSPEQQSPFDAVQEDTESSPAPKIAPPAGDPEATTITDNDWLRSRTSRLLGLVDDVGPAFEDTHTSERRSKGEASGGDRRRSNSETSDAGMQVDAGLVEQADTEARPAELETNTTATATGRLFVRNLPYAVTDQQLRHHFEQLGLGKLEEVHIPIDHRSGKNKGFAYVQYSEPEAATKTLQHLDGKPFGGRLLHIISSAAKRPSGLDEIAISKLPLKKQQQIKRKAAAASSTFNWNSMYMNADAVMSSISDRLGVPKSELLDPTSADAAVKQAHAETHIIQETKSYFSTHGVNLDAFKRKERGDTAILIKNFSYGTKPDELQKMFEVYGTIRRLLMPPSGTIAIVDFVQADQARSAFGTLAYRKFKDSVLFLEKAPKDLFTSETVISTEGSMSTGRLRSAKHSTGELLESTQALQSVNTSTLFVRNLNFSTTSDRLREVFQPLDGFLSARVKTKADPKNAGHVLSMGFGFLEFRTKAQAQAALAAMDSYNLDDHELLIRAAHKGADAAEERRRDDTAKKLAGRRTKIIIKNLPFEVSKKDVRSLFSAYGQLRSVRMPRKFDSSTRGFAFAEFVTAREAENAMDALKDTHLLGRRLVLDFAAEDEIDPEQEIAKMQQKAGKQADKVALQRLVGTGRKKFNLEGNDDQD